MKCFRAKLTDRKDAVVPSTERKGSPRHYCQRRLADSSLDEQEWLKRYTPERYHLEILNSNDDGSRPTSPSCSTTRSEIFAIRTTKNVFRQACLTITNLNFPQEVQISENKKPCSKKRSRYKSIPKNRSGHLHRMFVKSEHATFDEDSRTSSRNSTDYDEYELEEYLKQYNRVDDQSECSLFGYGEEEDGARKHPRTMFEDKPKLNVFQHESRGVDESSENGAEKTEKISNHKKEKRKSLTISRMPSPETIQIIRIDVISGYPIESDTSILSGFTDRTNRSPSPVDTLATDCGKYETHDHGTQTEESSPENPAHGGKARKFSDCDGLLYCKSLSLTDRSNYSKQARSHSSHDLEKENI